MKKKVKKIKDCSLLVVTGIRTDENVKNRANVQTAVVGEIAGNHETMVKALADSVVEAVNSFERDDIASMLMLLILSDRVQEACKAKILERMK